MVLSLDAGNVKSYASGSTVWYDKSGYGNNGTLVNGPGYSNGSIVFDGVNDYVITAAQPLTTNSSFTLECFINFSNFNNNQYFPIIDSGNFGSGTLGYCLAKDNTNKVYVAVNGGYLNVSNTINSNTWYHIVSTASYTTNYSFSIYINGILGTQSALLNPSTLTINQTTVKIANNYVGPSTYSNFTMGICKIYNRALSASEVLQNYNALKSRFNLS